MPLPSIASHLAPVPKRGKKNDPAQLRQTAELVAALRDQSLEQLAETRSTNAERLFGSELAKVVQVGHTQ